MMNHDDDPAPQEVPFPIFPWSLGAAPQPDRDGGVQLRHGGLLPALLL